MDKISFLTKAIAEKYTDISVEGAGAIKGKNCQIQSIEPITGGNRVTFAWYDGSDILVSDTLDVMDGADGQDGADGAKGDTGNGISKIEKTATSGLTDTYTITFTDGTTFDYDVVNGADGAVLSVNGKTGNVTLSTNDLVNDSGFIQNTVNNLVNYYLKSQIYTKTEVDNIVAAISTLSLSPVEQLPTTDISTTTIYLLPSSTQGVMDQYINLDGTALGWVKIGDTSIDLTDYVTSSDLTLALADYVTEAELSTYVVDADYVHTDNNYTDTDKAIVGGVTSALAGKADKSEIPEKTSELTNDSGFITNLVNDLANYYKKTETYTQTEVDALISAIVTLDIKVVATLPTTDISRTSIYLVPSADPQAQNVKDEYINLDGTSSGWELIGSTAIDLSDYVTDTDLATALADYTTTANLTTLLAAKQDTISDLATIRSGASAGATAYQKPVTGIPKTDLASALQTSLDKADTAVQDVSGKADKVSSATNGNFAGLDSYGNLTDSGKKANDFMASDGVTANPTGTATGDLTSIGIGGTKYNIPSGGGGTDENAYHTGDTAETTLADDDYFPFYDTSVSGKRKTLWSNIKSVLKTYFDTLYATVSSLASKAEISSIGTNETGTTASKAYAVGEHFYKNGKFCTCTQAIAQGATFTLNTNYTEGTISDKFLSYSTNEQFTGKYWIDGKPIYQRTYSFTTPNAATDVQNLLTVSNDITRVIKFDGVLWRSDGNDVTLPMECWKPSDATVNHWIDIWFNRSAHILQIGLGSSTALLGQTGYITLYYIK